MDRIHILDKDFEVSIKNETIQERVKALAERINQDYEGKNPIIICILNINLYDIFKKNKLTILQET